MIGAAPVKEPQAYSDRSFYQDIHSSSAAKPTLEQGAFAAKAAGTSLSGRIRRFASVHGTPRAIYTCIGAFASQVLTRDPGHAAGRRLRHGNNEPVTGLYFAGDAVMNLGRCHRDPRDSAIPTAVATRRSI